MKIEDFRSAIRGEFGANLEHATPANVREFLDSMSERAHEGAVRKRIVLNEPKTTYEEILRDFYARVLDMPTDDALILLWTMSFETSFAILEQHLADRFDRLFGDSE